MEIQKFIVDFETYCKTCKYKNVKEKRDPCNICLDIPARYNSKIPEYYKEGGKNDSAGTDTKRAEKT